MVSLQIIRPAIPSFADTPCNEPVAIPDRDLSEQEVASGWGTDRAALRTCELRRSAGVRAAKAG